MDPHSPDLDFHAPSVEELQPYFPAYLIQGFIAQGGMGAVYIARQISLDRSVAIKILPRQFGDDPQFRASFEAEAKAMARLNHPNLISVYDFGDADGMLFIIMELVKGKSLYHSAHGKAIEQKEAVRIGEGICRGLAHAHRAGILHRDIKPGNILLGPGAEPKIGDFGLARPLDVAHQPEDVIWGTPGYSAPEVLNSPEKVDARADIFAVGVLLYELLTSQLPGDPWRPPSSISGCHRDLDSITRRATHPSPDLRFSSAAEMADALDAVLGKLKGGLVRTPVTGPPATPSPSAGPGLQIRPAHAVLTSSKSRTAPIVISIILLAAVAIGAVLIASNRKRNAPDPTPPEASTTGQPKPTRPGPAPRPRPPVAVDDNPPEPDPDQPKPDNPPEPDPDQPRQESLSEALARLQEPLRGGDLSELPPTAARRGGAAYLHVPTPMSWQAAMHFAEDHGAHLAVLEAKDDLAWASETLGADGPAWVGLSDSGTEGKWHWVNGSEVAEALWAPGQPSNTTTLSEGEDFAALLPDASLDDLAAARQLPFLLQWNAEGENRGSLAAQAARVGDALKNRRAPVFPAGSRNIGGSRFLLIPQSLSWDEASSFATAAGGHLAVPSSQPEDAWINDTLQDLLGGGDGCWVGGRLEGVATPWWTFVTGERFDFVTWAPGQPVEGDSPLPFLAMHRDVDGQFGYANSSGQAGEASYFLLEWSAPSRRNMPSKEELDRPRRVEDWLLAQRKETADREKADYLRYQRRHDRNLADFIADIKSETETARNFSKEISDFVDALAKDLANGGEVPAQLENPAAQRFLRNIHAKALAEQEEIWEEYREEFEAARQRYLADVRAEMELRLRQGDRTGADYLARELEAAAEDPYFKQILGGSYPTVPEPAEEEDDDDDN